MTIKQLCAALLLAATVPSVPALAYSPAGNKIKTRWAAQVTPENAWRKYPRPQMQRSDWMNLNGLWDYNVTPLKATAPDSWRGQILVPYPYESSLSGVGGRLSADSLLWYTRSFEIPAAWKGKEIMLNFGAVDWQCEVYVNGKPVGSHTGGYSPFSLNITRSVKFGKDNTLTVSVYDPTDKGFQPRGKQVNRPRSIWYTPVSGIWQTVWLEPVAKTAVTGLDIVPDIDRHSLTVNPQISNPDKAETKVTVSHCGKTVASASAGAGNPVVIDMPADMLLWTPDDPNLYDLEITVLSKGKEVDKVKSHAAMRKITREKGADGYWRLTLNNKPQFQFGPLDQGWWPDGLYTAPTAEAMIYDIINTKGLGFNMIRKHVKVEPALWYHACDSLGIIIWQDMPSGDKGPGWQNHEYFKGTDGKRSEESKANFRREWAEIITALKPFGCIGVWVPFNESWGQFDTEKITAETAALDSTRLINPASGGNFFHCGDILDLHNYPGPAMYLYDPDRANVLGEYGGIGLALEGHLWNTDKNWGYVKFKTPREVTDEYAKYAMALRSMIDRGFTAAVYTQTTDVEGEVNGLMTYDRDIIKVDEPAIRRVNCEIVNSLNPEADRPTLSGLRPSAFRSDSTRLFTLRTANGIEACVTNYGGRIVSLMVPDKNGRLTDVVRGFDNLQQYVDTDNNFGALIGRYCNRICKGKFSIDSTEYSLPINNFGNSLHGGPRGFDRQIWNAVQTSDSTLVLRHTSPDGFAGYPGNLAVDVTYTLSSDKSLRIDFHATTDKPTIVNLTNHNYFNLSGNPASDITSETLQIFADGYTPIDETFIPLGKIEQVKGTPFDFTAPTVIADRVAATKNLQVKRANGIDHNFVLSNPGSLSAPRAVVSDPTSGISLTLYTDQPGVQVYTGNFLDGTLIGKKGIAIPFRGAICLEPQHFPDSPNNPQWPSTLLLPGQDYHTTTIYHFDNK